MRLGDNHDRVRALFERVTAPSSKLKSRKARFFFKRWLAFEEKEGDERSRERVVARAAEYVKMQGGEKEGGKGGGVV